MSVVTIQWEAPEEGRLAGQRGRPWAKLSSLEKLCELGADTIFSATDLCAAGIDPDKPVMIQHCKDVSEGQMSSSQRVWQK